MSNPPFGDEPAAQPSFTAGNCAFSELPAAADRLRSDVLARLRLTRIEALQEQLHTAQTELDVTRAEVELLRSELFDLRQGELDRASVAGPPRAFVPTVFSFPEASLVGLQPKASPGVGYRFVESGEALQAGDEVLVCFGDGALPYATYIRSASVGHRVDETPVDDNALSYPWGFYRRPLDRASEARPVPNTTLRV